METITRNLKVEVTVGEGFYQKVKNSISLFRATCRKFYSTAAMAEIAGSEIEITKHLAASLVVGKKSYNMYDEVDDKFISKHPDAEVFENIRITPDSTKAKDVLRKCFGNPGKALFYELIQWARSQNPTWLYAVPEAMRYDIVAPKWIAKDPEFAKTGKRITHGWLVEQGARAFARFMHIGIPIKNTMPKLEGHSVIMKWDTEIGPVEFKLGKLDGSRYYQWMNIRDGAWKLGTIYINIDEDGDMFLTISYTAPKSESVVNPEKTMLVSFGDNLEMYINCSGPNTYDGDKISVFEAVNGLNGLDIIAKKYKQCKTSAGNPRRVWGSRTMFKGVQKKVHNLANRRENYVKDRNHLWTRRITNNAVRWGCGRVVVVNIPEGEMFGHPWNWSGFTMALKYKLDEIGASVEFVKLEKEKVA